MIGAAIALLCACEPSATNQGVAAKTVSSQSDVTMRYLDFRHPSVDVPVDQLASGGGSRFVLVEVVDVANPARAPLTFDVSFRSIDGREARLGSFSLYPVDNPGRFIVATQGRVRAGGRVVVTMEAADAPGMQDVRVAIARVALVDD